MEALSEKPNQVLRLRIDRRTYNGLIVSMNEESMLVATTLTEKPEVAVGTLVEGEVPKPDGLYHFTSRVVGFQLMPMLVFILDRPKTMRRIQRRDHARYPVELEAQLLFVSQELTINEGAWVLNLGQGGMLLFAADVPPVGYHCMVLIQLGDPLRDDRAGGESGPGLHRDEPGRSAHPQRGARAPRNGRERGSLTRLEAWCRLWFPAGRSAAW